MSTGKVDEKLGNPKVRRIPRAQKTNVPFEGARCDVYSYKLVNIQDETMEDACWRVVAPDADHPSVPRSQFTPHNGRQVLRRADALFMFTEKVNALEERDENMEHVGAIVSSVGKGVALGSQEQFQQQVAMEDAPKV